MRAQRETFLFGETITTDVGRVRFLTYKEYLLNSGDLAILKMNVLHIYYQYRKMIDTKNQEAVEELEKIKDISLFDLVLSSKDIVKSYLTIFSMVLDEMDKEEAENALEKIFDDENMFLEFRSLVLDMNMLIEDEVSPNPEIQKGIELSRKAKSDGIESQTSTDIITSVVVGSNHSFKEISSMTVLQVYALYYRVNAFKSYETSTLFATVSNDVKIESWSKSIDLFAKETSAISKKEFDKRYGSLMK